MLMAYIPKCRKTKYILCFWNIPLFGWLAGLEGSRFPLLEARTSAIDSCSLE